VRGGVPTRILLILLVGGAVRSAAQQAPPERWHLQGSAGFDFTSSNQSILSPLSSSEQGSGNTGLLGDVRLNAGGYVLDPRFVDLNLSFASAEGANSTDIGSLSHDGLSWALTTSVLPKSRFPLRFYYARTRFASSGLSLDQTSNDSRLGLEWTILFSKLPRINLGFERYGSDVTVPTSFSDVSFHQRAWHVGANDTWKDWQWAWNFSDAQGSSLAAGGINLGGALQDSSRSINFTTSRRFWSDKANFSAENRELWRNDQLFGQGLNSTAETYTTGLLSVQHSEKLSSNYSYNVARVNFANGLNFLSGPTSGETQLLLPVSFTSNTLGAGVDYRLTHWLSLSQALRYTHTTPFSAAVESEVSLVDAVSGIQAHRTWRAFDFSARYNPRIQRVGTNMDRSADSFSNGFDGRIAWGTAQRVRLVGSYRVSKQNLLEQINGFSNDSQWRVDADTRRLNPFHIHLGAGRVSVELLNLSGKTKQEFTSFDLQVDHRLFSVSLGQSLGDGAGALFPASLQETQFLIVPLPIGTLIATPLLDRTTRSTSANLTFHLSHRLDLGASWRREKNLFQISQQNYRTYDIHGAYRIGKMSFEAGLGNFRTDIEAVQGLTGTRVNRYYIRVARDFKLF
jgi:hypothetical protein